MAKFRDKTGSEAAKQVYKKRGQVAEFPFAVIKDRYELRKFRVFDKVKAEAEAKWAVLTHNVMIWGEAVLGQVCEPGPRDRVAERAVRGKMPRIEP